MNKSKEFTEPPGEDRDDLLAIKGVGKKAAQALGSLGVNRYADLADFNPNRLASLLRKRFPSISPQRIKNEDWIGQARVLAATAQGSANFKPEKMEASSASPNRLEVSPAKGGQEAWRELADFFVSFGHVINPAGDERLQTRVHHSQGDKSQRWEGIASGQLFEWMLSAAHLRQPEQPGEKQLESEVQTDLATNPSDNGTYMEITDLWVSEVKVPAATGHAMGRPALAAEGRLELHGPQSMELTLERIPYSLDLHLVDIETHQSEIVATQTEHLMPGELTYEINQEFTIPMPGRYQLYMVARIAPPGAIFSYVQGPVIRVEP